MGIESVIPWEYSFLLRAPGMIYSSGVWRPRRWWQYMGFCRPLSFPVVKGGGWAVLVIASVIRNIPPTHPGVEEGGQIPFPMIIYCRSLFLAFCMSKIICLLPAICYLLSSVFCVFFLLPSSVFHHPSSIFHLPSSYFSICLLPSGTQNKATQQLRMIEMVPTPYPLPGFVPNP